MVRNILNRLEEDLGAYATVRLESWDEVERLVRQIPPKTNLVIPKSSLPVAPPHRRSFLGRGRGCLRQFRDALARHSLHVKEYEAHWVVHADAWNPHRHPVRHLWVDRGYSEFLHLVHVAAAPAAPAPATAPTPVGA